VRMRNIHITHTQLWANAISPHWS